MDASLVVTIAVVSMIIWGFVIHYIISSASRSQNIAKLNIMQVKILKEIALKAGIDPEKIEAIINKR